MIDCGNAKYDHSFMLQWFHIFRKPKNLKNVKRVCPKRIIKGKKE